MQRIISWFAIGLGILLAGFALIHVMPLGKLWREAKPDAESAVPPEGGIQGPKRAASAGRTASDTDWAKWAIEKKKAEKMSAEKIEADRLAAEKRAREVAREAAQYAEMRVADEIFQNWVTADGRTIPQRLGGLYSGETQWISDGVVEIQAENATFEVNIRTRSIRALNPAAKKILSGRK